MIRWLLSQRMQESDILQRYDRFVITRADHYYLCPHQFTDLDISNGTVWTPEGEDYEGITDRYVLVSKEHVLQVLDVLPSFLSKPFDDTIDTSHGWNPERLLKKALDVLPSFLSKPFEDVIAPFNGWNPERLLKQSWMLNGLNMKKFPRVMATCATKTDTTRWRAASEAVEGEPTLFQKYPSEWHASQSVCANRE